MGDDIEINVTETTNIIEITPQPNDQIVDIAVTDNAPNVEINVTPSVVEINVTRGSSTAIWGAIEGNLTDQSDLVTALGLKADLVDGKVPSTQLPSYVDDVIEVANYAALPTSGEVGKIYVTLDNNKIYRWSGSLYIEIAANQAIWGAITGNLGDQIDLQNALNTKEPTITAGTTSQYWRGDKSWQTLDKNAVGLGNVDNTSDLNKPISTATQTALDLKQNIITLTTSGTTGAATLVGSTLNIPNYTTDISGLVPYTGATGNVDLGTHKLTAADLVINHASGSGVAASITKGGNGEALTVVKSSGSGNAASITGGTTLLSELHLTTSLADAYIASAATWNAKQNALNGTGFVKISGTTISYDNSTYVPTARTLTINGTAYDLSANRSWTITAGVWGQITGILSDQTDLQTDLDAKTPTARTLTINGTAYDLSANRSWTIPTHDAVTIGTANGLSLSTQVLSLGLSSASANGALSSTDWTTFNNKQGALTFTSPLVNTSGTVSIPAATGSVNGYLTSADWTTFNNKQGALNGTGFVKISGTTISYDNSTYALDSVVVKLSGSQTIDGSKTFLADAYLDNNIYLKKTGSWSNPANYSVIGGMTHGFFLSSGTNKHAYLDLYQLTQARQYDFPNKSGTFAMTSDVPTVSGDANYIPKFTGASTLGNSHIYDNGTNIGIGTITPGQLLTLSQSINNTTIGLYNTNAASGNRNWTIGTNDQVYGDFAIIQSNANGGDPVAAGTKRFYINPSGNIGIGTFAPINGGGAAKWLTIDGTTNYSGGLVASINGNAKAYFYSQDGYAIVQGSTGEGVKLMPNGTNGLSIFSNGNTFIGASPTDAGYKLDVNGTGRFSNSVTATQGIFKNSGVPAIQAFRDLDVTSVGPAGQGIEFGARSGTTYIAGAAIYGGLGNPGTTGNLVFQTLNGGSLGTRLTIESTGAVSIAASSTGNSLTVNGTANDWATVINGNTTTSQAYGLKVKAGTNSTDNSFLVSNTSDTQLFRVRGDGNVGVGDVNPTVKLSVLDTATSSGEVARFQRNLDAINEYTYIKVGNSSYPAHFGSMLGVYDIAYMSMTPNPTDGKALCIRTTDGNVGIGVVNPQAKLSVVGGTGEVMRLESSPFDAASANGPALTFQLTQSNGQSAQLGLIKASADTSWGGILTFNTKENNGTPNNTTVERMRIFSNGNVGIGTGATDSGQNLQVNGNAIIGTSSATSQFRFYRTTNVAGLEIQGGAGSASVGQSAYLRLGDVTNSRYWLQQINNSYNLAYWFFDGGSWSNPITFTNNGSASFAGSITASGGFFNSDIRLKDVTDYDYNVSEIKPMNYYWKDKRDDKKHVGYSAQEVQKVMPDAVNEDENGMLSVNYIEVLVAKIAQMEKEIEFLKSK